jgi:hypothetical protein
MWSTGINEEYCTVKRGEMVVHVEDTCASRGWILAKLARARSGRDGSEGVYLTWSAVRETREKATLAEAMLVAADVGVEIMAWPEPVPHARPERVTVSVAVETTGRPQESYGEPSIVAERENEADGTV